MQSTTLLRLKKLFSRRPKEKGVLIRADIVEQYLNKRLNEYNPTDSDSFKGPLRHGDICLNHEPLPPNEEAQSFEKLHQALGSPCLHYLQLYYEPLTNASLSLIFAEHLKKNIYLRKDPNQMSILVDLKKSGQELILLQRLFVIVVESLDAEIIQQRLFFSVVLSVQIPEELTDNPPVIKCLDFQTIEMPLKPEPSSIYVDDLPMTSQHETRPRR